MENTINRGWLKRQIEQGNVEARRLYKYTDDYAYDADTDYGRTDWLPAYIFPDRDWTHEPDKLGFPAMDFTSYGHAYVDSDKTICLSFGYTAFALRLKDVRKATPRIKALLTQA